MTFAGSVSRFKRGIRLAHLMAKGTDQLVTILPQKTDTASDSPQVGAAYTPQSPAAYTIPEINGSDNNLSTSDNSLSEVSKLGIVTATKGNVRKHFSYQNGSAVKTDRSLSISRGRFENRTVDGLAGLKALIEGIAPNQALTLGVGDIDGQRTLVTGDKLAQMQRNNAKTLDAAIARTKDCIRWPASNYFILLDHDPEPGKPDLTADEFWSELCGLVPELSALARLVTTSTSSGIYHSETGECLKPEAGHHTYLQVTGDVNRLVELIKVRGWMHGASFFKLANANIKTGVQAILERHILDTAVFSAERLVYEAGAQFESGSPLEQRRTPPRLYAGDVLNLNELPAPTADEIALAAVNKAAARAEIAGEQLLTATAAVAAEGHRTPKKEAVRRITLATKGKLEHDHILEIASGGILRVSDISAVHDGIRLCDPQEPTYRGGADVARIYWNDGRGWVIHSQAHGGCSYTAAARAAQPADLVEGVISLAEKKAARDRESYEMVCSIVGLPASTVQGLDKTEAREALYPHLVDFLGSELTGDIQTGFVSSIPIDWQKRGLYVFDASKGTGKTDGALMAAILDAIDKDERTLLFAPTRSLAQDLASRINRLFGAKLAVTHKGFGHRTAQIVVSCPESAYKFTGQNFGLVMLDEANENVERIQSGNLGNAPQKSNEAFNNLLRNAKQVVIATDDMWGRTLSTIQRIGRFDAANTHIQRRIRPATKMNIVTYKDFVHWLSEIVNAIAAGLRVSIPCGAQGKGRQIDRILRALFPEKNGIVLDGVSTMANLRSQFLENPDGTLSKIKPDWFIFSPVVNSGVSIEGAHFDLQAEYITPSEGAQQASQRGERVRSALGRDGAITRRIVFFSERGQATLESYPEALNPSYWAETLANEETAHIGAAAAMAKSLGAERALKPLADKTKVRAGLRPELPDFLAIRALDVFFKRERLTAEWLRYGWTVAEASAPSPEQEMQIAALRSQIEDIRIGLIRQDARITKKTRTRIDEDIEADISNPFQGARAKKAALESILSKEFLKAQNENFYTAVIADNSTNNPDIGTIRRGRLLAMAIERPAEFKRLTDAKAIKALAGKTPQGEHWHLDSLPAPARDIEIAAILSKCSALTAALSGELEEWSNYTKSIIQAGEYLVENAAAIAANTKRSGLKKGAQFTAKMKPAQLFKKGLELAGITTKKRRAGQGKRWNIHSLESVADVRAQFETTQAVWAESQPSPLTKFKAEMRLARAEYRGTVVAAIDAQLHSKLNRWYESEADIEQAISSIRTRHTLLLDKSLTKGCDGPLTDAPSTAGGEVLTSAEAEFAALVERLDREDTEKQLAIAA